MKIGDLVILKQPENQIRLDDVDVRVYFVDNLSSENGLNLTAGTLPVFSVGIIVKETIEGTSYHVMFKDKIIFVSDSYIEPFDDSKQLFINYEDDERDFLQLETI